MFPGGKGLLGGPGNRQGPDCSTCPRGRGVAVDASHRAGDGHQVSETGLPNIPATRVLWTKWVSLRVSQNLLPSDFYLWGLVLPSVTTSVTAEPVSLLNDSLPLNLVFSRLTIPRSFNLLS